VGIGSRARQTRRTSNVFPCHSHLLSKGWHLCYRGIRPRLLFGIAASCTLTLEFVILFESALDCGLITWFVAWVMTANTFFMHMIAPTGRSPRSGFLRAFANVLDSLCSTPQTRTGADGLTECARQMALIRKPASAGNLRESFVGS
jgi:hypothetical protein